MQQAESDNTASKVDPPFSAPENLLLTLPSNHLCDVTSAPSPLSSPSSRDLKPTLSGDWSKEIHTAVATLDHSLHPQGRHFTWPARVVVCPL